LRIPASDGRFCNSDANNGLFPGKTAQAAIARIV
jgi:hypothetical protein